VEIVSTYLERIEKHDDSLNAFVTVLADASLDAARRAEEDVIGGNELAPFHGVPIPIKDLNETAGIKTTFSSKIYADYVPDEDAATVRRLKEAGFILLGKTNTPEFGTIPLTESHLNGVCRNPWNTDLTPGGSSGGAAAALAAGLCPVAHGNDGGGSIRIPASCCGLFGLKPARGRVSWAPRFGTLLVGFATDGVIARTVRDAAAVLDTIVGYEPGDPYWLPGPERPFADEAGAPPGRARIGVTTTAPNGAPVDPECIAAVEDAAKLLESLGHDVEEAAPDWVDPNVTLSFVRVYQTLSAYYDVPDVSQLEPINRALAEAAMQTNSIDFVKAVNEIQVLARRVVAFWQDHDFLLTPTLALPPVPTGWLAEGEDDPAAQFFKSALFVPFTPAVNLTGQPAVSIPLRWTDSGLPIGVQLIGPPAGEGALVRISAQVEEARPWADRRPPVS
jgi:amidase